jgi:ABC-2 type transport system ATP-binding protein
MAHAIGYLPEERGLYPAMKAYEAIAFVGALRGLPLAEGRRRGRALLEEHGLGYAADRQIRQMSKGMAQQVQIARHAGSRTAPCRFRRAVLGPRCAQPGQARTDDPGLADKGTTVIFSTHVIAHAERLCDEVAIIAGGKVPFAGPVDVARDRIRPQVRLETRAADGPWRAALPADARQDEGRFWYFSLPETGVEPLLRA